MKPRVLSKTLLKAIKTFPAVVITGPRQSGKTTLLKMLFSKKFKYVSLENPDVRMTAKEDPVGFLKNYSPPLIIDEIQYIPELLSYIKTDIDRNRRPGRWIFTGSQNFTLMKGVSQSLAGRAAVLSLLPFSQCEILGEANHALNVSTWLRKLKSQQKSNKISSVGKLILRGGYPELALHKNVDRQLWCGAYISTYLERDVRNLSQIGDLTQFEQFLRLCAVRTGQILNLSDMARDIGVSVPTAKRWLSMLEASYQIYLLRPYYRNIGKRLVKSPKIYFSDTALASYLLGVHDGKTLANSPNFGNLFETMIINDLVKRFANYGEMPSMYYLRTRDGLEIDLVLDLGQRLHLFEIKSSATLTSKHASSLIKFRSGSKLPIGSSFVVSQADTQFKFQNKVDHVNWTQMLST